MVRQQYVKGEIAVAQEKTGARLGEQIGHGITMQHRERLTFIVSSTWLSISQLDVLDEKGRRPSLGSPGPSARTSLSRRSAAALPPCPREAA